jgi:GNAT superfamily N-acetyltransferase
MTIKQRTYKHDSDFDKVSQLLVDTYYDPKTPQNGHINWLQSRWEYMNFHPLIKDVNREAIGVWESDGEIVGVVHPEHPGSPTYFEIRQGFESLKSEMLEYAIEHFDTTEVNHAGIYLMGGDNEFAQIASDAGYSKVLNTEPMSMVSVDGVDYTTPMPLGFSISSLAEDSNPQKVHRLLYRGFNHGDEPEESCDDGIADREFMQSAPNFDPLLNVVAVAPNGDWVSYCGMWYESNGKYGYVEPVATDPDYRLRGIGKAVVTEGIRRCKQMGAEVAYVGSTQPVYLSIGFRQVYTLEKWLKRSS